MRGKPFTWNRRVCIYTFTIWSMINVSMFLYSIFMITNLDLIWIYIFSIVFLVLTIVLIFKNESKFVALFFILSLYLLVFSVILFDMYLYKIIKTPIHVILIAILILYSKNLYYFIRNCRGNVNEA